MKEFVAFITKGVVIIKKIKWQVNLGVLLILLSAVLYFADYSIFHKGNYIFQILLDNLAFIPVQVLVVSLIIEKVIEKRENQKLLEKLNMVVGVFFSEMGTKILMGLIKFDPNFKIVKDDIIINNNWTDRDFDRAFKMLKKYDYSVKIENYNLEQVKKMFVDERNFLLSLMQNSNLMEHESFTQLLNAVFHLEEELSHRDLSKLSLEDKEHIEFDMIRVYKCITLEWLQYMKHLRVAYPYLYNAALKIPNDNK